MATPRFTGPKGVPKQPPFGKLSPQAKKSGPQPPIPAKKPKTSKPFAKLGKPGMMR